MPNKPRTHLYQYKKVDWVYNPRLENGGLSIRDVKDQLYIQSR